MRILHVIPSVSPARGGPSVAIRMMQRALSAAGADVTVLTTDDDGPGRRDRNLPLGRAVVSDGADWLYFAKDLDFYTVSLGARRWLRRHAGDFDAVHIHAVFSFTSIVAAQAARRAGVPYIIRPLGVLNRYGMTARRPLLKAISMRLFERRILTGAAAIHFTAKQEAEEARHLGLDLRGEILPLAVEPQPAGDAGRWLALHPHLRDRFRILYLSRLDPKKNLEGLLGAVGRLSGQGRPVALMVCGGGDAAYEASLRDSARRAGAGDAVTWLGHVSGEGKADAMAAADLFVLPSHSENFGIAVVEALSTGLPVVVSRGVGVSDDLERAGAARICDTSAEDIAAKIAVLIDDPDARRTLAKAGAALYRDAYGTERMAERLCDLYRRVVNGKGSA
ncbi:MAG: glycosyltransferase [Pseudomonadota bacterium]|nr:glycosyltransferase [Pseudomonadota bacterium]